MQTLLQPSGSRIFWGRQDDKECQQAFLVCQPMFDFVTNTCRLHRNIVLVVCVSSFCSQFLAYRSVTLLFLGGGGQMPPFKLLMIKSSIH